MAGQVTLVGVLVTIVALILSCAASGYIYGLLQSGMERPSMLKYEVVVDLFSLLGPSRIALLFGLIARDILLCRHLRLVIEDKLNRIRCLECKYILIGQSVFHDRVRCPECGHLHTLIELGIVEEDLIPPRKDEVTAFAPDR